MRPFPASRSVAPRLPFLTIILRIHTTTYS